MQKLQAAAWLCALLVVAGFAPSVQMAWADDDAEVTPTPAESDAPGVDQPVEQDPAEAPTEVEAPAEAEEPTEDAGAAEDAGASEEVTEESATDESAAEEPMDESAAEEPVAEEPAAEETPNADDTWIEPVAPIEGDMTEPVAGEVTEGATTEVESTELNGDPAMPAGESSAVTEITTEGDPMAEVPEDEAAVFEAETMETDQTETTATTETTVVSETVVVEEEKVEVKPMKVDIKKLAGTLRPRFNRWDLTVDYRVKVKHRANSLNLHVYVRRDKNFLVRDRLLRPIGVVIPLTTPTKVEKDGDEIYEGEVTVPYPFFPVYFPSDIKTIGYVFVPGEREPVRVEKGSMRIDEYDRIHD